MSTFGLKITEICLGSMLSFLNMCIINSDLSISVDSLGLDLNCRQQTFYR